MSFAWLVPTINERTKRHNKHVRKQKTDIDTYNINAIDSLICTNQIKGDVIMY
jgi:hypothetical protein